jgi:hypothetical protein
MLGRPRTVSVPSNEGVAVVPTFAPDPHGAAMFHLILNSTMGQLGSRVAMDTRGKAWHGWTAPPQGRMTGAANLGRARPVINPTTRFDQAQGIPADSVQQVMGQRAAQGRFS